MLFCFLLGIVASLPFFILSEWSAVLLLGIGPIATVATLAFFEEFMKALMLIFSIELSRRWFTQIVDGLIYASSVALGFSFAENIYYLLDFVSFDVEFAIVYAIRSFNTMVAHTVFAAFFGFFYASAYLRDEIFPKMKRVKPWEYFWKNLGESLPLHVTFSHLLPNRPSKHGHFPGSLMLEGIFVATLLHALFNIFLKERLFGTSLSFLTFPLVMVTGYLLWRIFLQRMYIKIVKKAKGEHAPVA